MFIFIITQIYLIMPLDAVTWEVQHEFSSDKKRTVDNKYAVERKN